MLVLLAAACGQRYEIGEVLQRPDQVGSEDFEEATRSPLERTQLIATLVADSRDDVDVRVGIGTQSYTGIGEDPIGDVDGDGYDDWITENFQLVYGAPRSAGDTFPEVGAPVTTFSFGPGAEPSPRANGSRNSSSITPQPVGDVDGDGCADLLFESRRNGGGSPASADFWSSQRAYLWYGRAQRPVGEVRLQDEGVEFTPLLEVGDGLVAAAAADGSSQALSLSAIGDLDGDGFDDFAFSYAAMAPSSEFRGYPNIDRVALIYYGGTERLPSTGATALPAAVLSGTGFTRPVGDINGDGFADLLAVHGNRGLVESFIILGGAQRLSGESSAAALGLPVGLGSPSVLGQLSHLRSAGDLDRDGFDDFIITDMDSLGTQAFLFYGSPSWANTAVDRDLADAVFAFEGGRAQLFPVGDWNGDGSNDLVLKQQVRRGDEILDSYSREAEWRGQVSVIPGQARRYSGDYATSLIHPELPARDLIQFNGAFDVYPIGDIDGDGFADVQFLMETAVRTNPVTQEAFIKYGGPLGGVVIH
jgi:hypothetical protein